jgi:hypothetical protein
VAILAAIASTALPRLPSALSLRVRHGRDLTSAKKCLSVPKVTYVWQVEWHPEPVRHICASESWIGVNPHGLK